MTNDVAPSAHIRSKDIAEIETHVNAFAGTGPQLSFEHKGASYVEALAAPDRPLGARPPQPAERRWHAGYILRLLVADTVAAVVGTVAATTFSGTLDSSRTFVLTPAYVVGWLLILGATRTFEVRRLGVGYTEYGRVVRSGIWVFGGVALAKLLVGSQMGRSAALGISVTVAADLIGRGWVRHNLYRCRWKGRSTDRVVAIGTSESVAHLVAALRREAHQGLEVVGACVTDFDPRTEPGGSRRLEISLGVPVLGGHDDVLAAVIATKSHAVVVAGGGDIATGALRRLAWSLEELGTEMLVSPGLVEVAGRRLTVRPYASVPLLHVQQPRLSGTARAIKGAGDRLVALLLLVLLSPFLVLVAVLVHQSSPGGVFYRQERVGLNGEHFQLWKFRSMVPNADELIAQLQTHNEKDGALFKMRRDPRVTKVGSVLRRFSIDELPQLLNVVGGSMSLVGPRPPLPREVEQYASDVRRRLLVRPGITGLWQVSGRSELTWDESIRLDLRYVENWTVGLDVSILWRTARAVVSGRGAY